MGCVLSPSTRLHKGTGYFRQVSVLHSTYLRQKEAATPCIFDVGSQRNDDHPKRPRANALAFERLLLFHKHDWVVGIPCVLKYGHS